MEMEMDIEVYDAIRALAYEQAGMAMGEGKQALVQSRIAKRMRALGLETPRNYLEHLYRDSSGEEPYNLSLVLQETLGTNFDLKILATDISTRVLKACREGIYGPERMAAVPPPLRERWFEPHTGDLWSAGNELRRPLSFARLNLAHPPYPMTGPFDVIFCRNVMIYFDMSGRQKFVEQAQRLLRPGGYLFVGTSESLNGISTSLRGVRPSVYRKEGE